MDTSISQRQSKSWSQSFIKGLIVVGLALIIFSLAFASARQVIVYAQQGIKGYVVGPNAVAAYACPDTNITKCPIKLTLQPGTEVLIVDNVVGGAVPGSNDNAWRKIVYKGQTLFVPMRYISINPPNNSAGNAQDISFVQTSHDSVSSPNNSGGSGFSTAPGSGVLTFYGNPPPPPFCQGPNLVIVDKVNGYCCPPGGYEVYAVSGGGLSLQVSCRPSRVTFYTATDGRMNGNAGDRIAIYCRQTGRIEVWSINDSQGHFLVEFNHAAVDAAGRAGFHVTVPGQGVVTIGGDGHGQYWASLSGGPFNATGTGDFAKTFSCYVK